MRPWPDDPLLQAERDHVAARRTRYGIPPEATKVGLALSGGGIRSATFSLGILRELGARKLLPRIDYLSTVSGGSYIGSFYCGMFAPRKGVTALLDASTEADPFADPLARGALGNLRQSGRYLAPQGGGDYIYATALLIRNWFAIQIVIGSIILPAAILMLLARLLMPMAVDAPLIAPHLDAGARALILAAPLLVACVLCFVVALGWCWAYWLTPRDGQDSGAKHAVPILFSVGVLLFGLAWARLRPDGDLGYVAALLPCLGLLFFAASRFVGRDAAGREERWDAQRVWLTQKLVLPNRIFAIAALLAAIDWATFSLLSATAPADVPRVFVTSSVMTGLLVPIGRNLLKRLTGDGAAAGKPGGWAELLRAYGLSIGTTLGAALLSLALVFLWTGLAYESLWPRAPVVRAEAVQSSPSTRLEVRAQPPQLSVTIAPGTPTARGAAPPAPAERYRMAATLDGPERDGTLRLGGALLLFLFLLAATIAVTPRFLNLSSLATFYSGRLRRAYLGAGNLDRLTRDAAIDTALPSDDILLRDYYRSAIGAPLHLINVTVNETNSSGSNVVQRDRHGRNMVLSPAGLLIAADDPRRLEVTNWMTGMHEQLPLSAWIGISGAAFSTGLGARTSLPFAVLAGLTNVRLGYWWRRSQRAGQRPTQLYLLDEFAGRFPGLGSQRLYLSDGGHFENTGVYELIRRRLPFIIVSDNGQDEAYEWEDVANLVRKARIDFEADIAFLDAAALSALFKHDAELRQSFGTLAEISGREKAGAKAVAALARVTYGDGTEGTLVLIKPRLTLDGPADLIRYKEANGNFPQQTTLDQFFDEAQWESYYLLGRLITRAVFKRSNGWSPAALTPLPPR